MNSVTRVQNRVVIVLIEFFIKLHLHQPILGIFLCDMRRSKVVLGIFLFILSQAVMGWIVTSIFGYCLLFHILNIH